MKKAFTSYKIQKYGVRILMGLDSTENSNLIYTTSLDKVLNSSQCKGLQRISLISINSKYTPRHKFLSKTMNCYITSDITIHSPQQYLINLLTPFNKFIYLNLLYMNLIFYSIFVKR